MNVDDTSHLARALWKVRKHVAECPGREASVFVDAQNVEVGGLLDVVFDNLLSNVMSVCAARVPKFNPEMFLRIVESDKELEFEEKTGGVNGNGKPKPKVIVPVCPVCEGKLTVGGLPCVRCCNRDD